MRMVQEAGLQPADSDMAFSRGKTDRSRYLKIGRGTPTGILQWIGKAPSAGRPRWEQLVAALESDETAEPRIREVLAATNDQERPATIASTFRSGVDCGAEPGLSIHRTRGEQNTMSGVASEQGVHI